MNRNLSSEELLIDLLENITVVEHYLKEIREDLEIFYKENKKKDYAYSRD